MRIIISRTDSIGDVVLTLPLAGVLKQSFPGCTIIFLGRDYTRAVVELCKHVDEFVSWGPLPRLSPQGVKEADRISLLKELKADIIIHVFPVKEICSVAKQAGIPLRIAPAGRIYTWFTCNKLLYIPRKNSNLHEAQLNLKMLKGLGIDREFGLEEIGLMYGFREEKQHQQFGQADDETAPFTLILHPKSKGSAREWGLENFSKLITLLPAEKFKILITGTRDEGTLMADFLESHRGRVKDLTGQLTLAEFIALIGSADGLVAASTGPLHLAAALGIRAVGLYAPMRPIFPQRWAPIGKNATFLVLNQNCHECRKSMECKCIKSITPEEVAGKLMRS